MKNFIVTVKILSLLLLIECKSTEIETETETETEDPSFAEDPWNIASNDSSEILTPDTGSNILPEGYSLLPDGKLAYKINSNHLTWEEARDQCIFDDGDLAIIDTWNKIAFITSIDSEGDKMLHVGFNKPKDFDEWLRVDNDLPVSWLPWLKKHLPAKDRYCVVALPGMKGLLNVDCSLRAKSVCEISVYKNDLIAANDDALAKTNSDFPNGYLRFARFSTAYRIYDDFSTHHEARERCSTDGGHLAIVDSFEKVRAIAALPKTGSLHVGIRVDSVYFEKWVADSNGEALANLPWTPNNPRLTKCAALREDGTGLEETVCSNRLQFVCEIRQDI